MVDERVFQLTLELAKNKKSREELYERYDSDLSELLDKLET